MKDFLPISLAEIKERNWDSIDFLFVNGDAYVDHPSFAGAVICRILEAQGYKVAMLCQPDWHDIKNFAVLGKPNYAVLICGGNLDSMLCHYTAARKKRSDDKYTPGGAGGKRPDHATVVYSQCVKKLWPDMPVVIGGIEASLRRFVHYDFWENALLPSILEDSGADLLVFGMGEKQIVEIADYLAGGACISDLHYIKGTAYACDKEEIANLTDFVELPAYKEIIKNRKMFASAYNMQADEQDPIRGKTIVQQGKNKFIVQNPPAEPLSEKEMDAVYDIEYQRLCHPSYNEQGGVPALDEVKFSIISSRGCFGSCSFCAIHAHQGRIIQARSHASVLQEAKLLTTFPDFKGYIHDVGGPTANFRHPSCAKQLKVGTCKDKKCLFPEPCPNLNADHSDYAKLLNEIRALPKIKKVFIRSGIRYDYLLCDKNDVFFKQLCEHHVSGQLKIAPEHISDSVLAYMGKPGKRVYMNFMRKFQRINKELKMNQFLVPYFISSHPGSKLQDAVSLAEFLRDIKHYPKQVQDFIPTPGSASTAMYYSGVDLETGKDIYVAKSANDKAMQRALLQYRNPRNYRLVLQALRLAKREDLIGKGPKCLIH